MGSSCADICFADSNVTESWAEAKQTEGYRHVSKRAAETLEWVASEQAVVKVVQGHTRRGVNYLNLYVDAFRAGRSCSPGSAG